MGENARQGNNRVGELGPHWINAISALIGAVVAGAGLFFVGKASTSEAAAPSIVTRTVTVTAAPDDRSSGAAEPSSGGVYWSGDLVWGTHDLDARPPSDRAGFWHDKNFTEGVLRAGSTGILRLWFDRSTPDRDDCVAAVAEGSSEVRGIKAGNYVCGRTAAGRPFRIQVFGAGSAEVSGHVTVWEK